MMSTKLGYQYKLMHQVAINGRSIRLKTITEKKKNSRTNPHARYLHQYR